MHVKTCKAKSIFDIARRCGECTGSAGMALTNVEGQHVDVISQSLGQGLAHRASAAGFDGDAEGTTRRTIARVPGQRTTLDIPEGKHS